QVLLRLLSLARAAVELAEPEVAVGDERAHAARLGERQSLAVVRLAALSIEAVRMGCDVAEQVQRMGRESRLLRRRFDRAHAEVPRLVKSAKLQTSATKRVVVPALIADESPRCLALEELLALSLPAQCLARLAELCQDPGGEADCPGK